MKTFQQFCEDAYPISLNLITEARNHLLLNSEIPIQLPTCLIHGMMDKDVPYSTSIRIAEKFIGNDIKVHLIKDANHGLSRTEDLEFISNIINDLIKNCKFK